MDKLNPFIELLRADGSIVVNKRLAKAVGLREAVLFSELISRHRYFQDRGKLDKEGYFFNTIEDLQGGTTLTRRHQDAAIKALVQAGLVKVKLAGVPAKRYFKINNDMKVLLKILGIEIEPAEEQEETYDPETMRVLATIGGFRRAGAEGEITAKEAKDIIAKGKRTEKRKKKWKQIQ